ncbi:TolC family protein [Aeoliella mucimassa]|uniref:Outer membrane efflux protein n=1 Tax=Aeoliella mucimassa TaxID=2527972 RepID=A0A518AI10_9BACT|nr:TolC family protein [Aeoliella mucimassa]QDU54368.1 Outer membrane efflux protein [Aeoliella mucimassa]
MHRQLRIYCSLLMLCTSFVGCRSNQVRNFQACSESCDSHYKLVSAEIEYPATNSCTQQECDTTIDSLAPRTLATDEPAEYQDVTLAEVVELAFANSDVLRDVGAAVVRSPDTTRTQMDPGIVETNPAQGIESALSVFDAQWTTSMYFENNDRQINNEFFGGGIRTLQQNVGAFQTQLSKLAVTGTELSARKIVEFDGNNAPGNLFDDAWTVKVEGEVRHPLLQGSGTQFNRIAGPTKTPGNYTGVVIARIRTDVELADFEVAVRDYVSNVENAYWDLYFAYRDLDAQVAARDASLETWRRVRALYESGRRGGEAEKEAQAREQFYRFQEEVQNSLAGRLFDGTRTNNGSMGGTFRGTGGVLVAERRLRRLLNLPASDGRLLRPADEPILAPVAFDWYEISTEAVARRAELRRQRFQVRRRELELIASKNFLMPRLDVVGRYRFRGFGKDLIDSNGGTLPRFDNAYEDLMTGDFQEWQAGFELDMPIGFRRAHTAVRNAEMELARSRAILRDQQEEVVHATAASIAEMDRALIVSQTSYNRLQASREQLAAIEAAFEADKASLDLLLDAQRRVAEAETRYYRTLAEYAIAIKNVHFSKGTLLEYDGVYLAEGAWPAKAYRDAADLERRRGRPRPLNYASSRAPVVAHGAHDQHPSEHSLGTMTPVTESVLPEPKEAPTELPLTPSDEIEQPSTLTTPVLPGAVSAMPTSMPTAMPTAPSELPLAATAGPSFLSTGQPSATLASPELPGIEAPAIQAPSIELPRLATDSIEETLFR